MPGKGAPGRRSHPTPADRIRGELDRPPRVAGVDVVLERLPHALQRLTEVVALSAQELGAHERNEQVGGLLVQRPALPRGERALEVGNRVLIGVGGKGLLAGEPGVVDELPRSQHRLGLREVVRELGSVSRGLLAVQLLESHGDLCVKSDAPSRGQLSCEGLLEERMREAVGTGFWRQFFQNARGERLLDSSKQLVLRAVDYPRNLLETELPSDHRSELKHVVALCGETIEPAADHLAQPFRHADAPVPLLSYRLGRQPALPSSSLTN